VDDAWLDRLPEADEMENQMLDCVAAERRANSRLGCQVNVSDEVSGMIIRIPETQY
jgi:2Fe-2S ferredoxin